MTGRGHRPEDGPLFAWGEALRSEKLRRSRRRRRIAITGTGIVVLLASAALPPSPRLVWNASASAPIGLYMVTHGAAVGSGDMVIARVPKSFRRFAAERRYLPVDVPLVKQVAAVAGHEICARGTEIFVDGHHAVDRRAADGAGRPMPAWSGCVRLDGGRIFLLNDDPMSFDGRYFGTTEARDVVGKARLLWRL